MRKEAVKLAVKELGKAVTRAGLRSHSGPGKKLGEPLISTSNIKGRSIIKRSKKVMSLITMRSIYILSIDLILFKL